MPFELDSRAEYIRLSNESKGVTPVDTFYLNESVPWTPPPPLEYKDSQGETQTEKGTGTKRNAKPSIFNRYSIFYFNSTKGSGQSEPEEYIDGVNKSPFRGAAAVHNRRGLDNLLLAVEREPTAANIIRWAQSGSAVCMDYAWPDFLWCKNYGMIPNNYMVTLRRFAIPAMDDLTDNLRNPSPDIGRMITWVDGENNTWESVGLKWSHKLEWSELTSEIQTVNVSQQAGNEGGAFGGMVGNIIKAASWATQPGSNEAALGNPNRSSFNPWDDKNKTYGAVDIIKKMIIRGKGLDFEQAFTLKFEYELRSIDGINPRIAMIDLLSNVMHCTMNRGSFWGGEVKYTGGDPRRIKPIGDTSKLAKGDYAGYMTSLGEGIMGRLDALTGGAGLSLEGISNAAKNIGGSIVANVIGQGLDKMGRPGVQGVNSLLTGEDTGEWHVTVGNPANPIISVGNLILEKTDIQFGGSLGIDDFPTSLTVICTLKAARPRDRTDILAMFHKNGRTYLSTLPSGAAYSATNLGGRKNGKPASTNSGANANAITENQPVSSTSSPNYLSVRFPNHTKEASIVDTTAEGTV
jgi:hypothetical protein